MFSEPVVYVDLETTGVSAQRAKIIEVGAIRVEDGEVVEEFKSFINPGAPIPYFITNITGITDADVVQAPYFEDIAYQLDQILKGAIFIAHNVRFDYSFIKNQLESSGYKFRPKMLCTVRLSRALYPEARGHSLEKIILRHGLRVSARHRAYDDA
ncbi:MAG TPA: 3'-5' exonuclease, partial [Candidatus Saccharimonadales bacterium]|nr:3'-5' exonuclease [Candidatus Saccharimonadales bacterium]